VHKNSEWLFLKSKSAKSQVQEWGEAESKDVKFCAISDELAIFEFFCAPGVFGDGGRADCNALK
jgi:hypothetical protein